MNNHLKSHLPPHIFIHEKTFMHTYTHGSVVYREGGNEPAGAILKAPSIKPAILTQP